MAADPAVDIVYVATTNSLHREHALLAIAAAARGRGVGKALLYTQVMEADRAGLWTLQTSIFPENRASIARRPPPLRSRA